MIIKKYKTPVILVTLVIAIVVIGQYFLNKDSSGTNQTQATTEKAGRGNIVESVSASGQIQTANYLAVTTSVNGIVKKVFVK